MYLEMAEKVDKEMVERWKDDAEGMLTFVGFRSIPHSFEYNAGIVDWVVLSCRCGAARNVYPGHSTELAGHVGFVCCAYRSAALAIQRNSARSHPAIFSTYMVRLGQRALVDEPLYRSYLRTVGDLATTMGTSLSQGRLPTAKSSQASTHSRILFGGSREVARSVGG